MPNNILNLAVQQATMMHCNVLIYKYNNTYVTLPVGYEIKTGAELIGYVTKDLKFIESNGSYDETTKSARDGVS